MGSEEREEEPVPSALPTQHSPLRSRKISNGAWLLSLMPNITQSSTRPFGEYRNTPLWRAVAHALSELEASNEVSVSTAPEYVIGYLCRELAAKRVVITTALAPD